MRTLLSIVLLVALAGSLWVVRQSSAQDSTGAAVGHAATLEGLETHMEALNRDVRRLSRQLDQADKNSSSLELIADMESHVLAAKLLEPPMATTLSGRKKDEFLVAYRKQMIVLLDALLEMERQVLEGKNSDAKETFQKLQQIESEGHSKFREEE